MEKSKQQSFRELSKKEWTLIEGTVVASNDVLILGCLQRIADAQEKLAEANLQVVHDLAYYQKRTSDLSLEVSQLKKTNKTLRGHLTRLKPTQE
jgi:hypothetical protein